MRVTRDFEYALCSDLRNLCIQNDYFTCGTNRQYERMFNMAVMPEFTYRDIAMMIFTCSDKTDDQDELSFFSDIQNQVETIWRNITEAEARLMMAERFSAETT